MVDTIVRHAKLEDTVALEQFYYRAYGERARYKYPERWNWHFRDNPWGNNVTIPVYIAETPDGQIVGHTASVRVPCKIFYHQIKLGWSVDTIVLPEARGMGAGKKLQKINQDDNNAFASLAMSETNRHIKLKLGAVTGPSAKLYVKFLKFDCNKPLHILCCVILRVLQLFKNRLYTQTTHWKICQPSQATFDKTDTDLWQNIRLRYDFAVERNADYLNWRYRDQPWTKYFCRRAYDIKGQLAGISVYRMAEEIALKAAIITELMCISTGDTTLFCSLLSAIEGDVLNLGGTQIQLATSDPQIEEALEQSGYFLADLIPLVINGPQEIIGNLTPQSTSMLTKGDQDWDQYPLANFFSPIDVISHWRISKWIKKTTKFL